MNEYQYDSDIAVFFNM